MSSYPTGSSSSSMGSSAKKAACSAGATGLKLLTLGFVDYTDQC